MLSLLLLQGDHCAVVTVTVDGMKISPAVAGFPSRFTTEQTVCWYRISEQTKAKFEFDMCSSKHCKYYSAYFAILAYTCR